MAEPVAIRDAATIVLVRRDGPEPRLLMGQRGAGAVFLPNKFVFPGGGVDPEDVAMAGAGHPEEALRLAAIRELWEETGLRLGPPDRPATGRLTLVFRAVTPPFRPRRFDARFYLAAAEDLSGSPDDFSGASGELLFLRWIDLPSARKLELPFITEVVLAEIAARLGDPGAAHPVPFFDQTERGSHFRMLDA